MPPETANVIVIVDDDKEEIVTFKHLLAKAGMKNRLIPILDGDDAAAFFERAATSRGGVSLPLICFLNLRMPGRTGLELLEWIRRTPALDLMPVIMLSAIAHRRDVARAAELGAQCFLKKHPSPLCLRQAIKHAALYSAGHPTRQLALFGFSANLLKGDPLQAEP